MPSLDDYVFIWADEQSNRGILKTLQTWEQQPTNQRKVPIWEGHIKKCLMESGKLTWSGTIARQLPTGSQYRQHGTYSWSRRQSSNICISRLLIPRSFRLAMVHASHTFFHCPQVGCLHLQTGQTVSRISSAHMRSQDSVSRPGL